MENIGKNLAATRRRIDAAEQKYGRPGGSVRLLAVSKAHSVEAVRLAYAAGQVDFGENYLQEALDKINRLRTSGIRWHFIGSIQSNKARLVAEHFDWVQGLAREKIALRLSDGRPMHLPPLNVCIQVNISGEASKSGISPSETEDFSRFVAGLPGLRLRGLMCIPAAVTDFNRQRTAFRQARELFENLQHAALPVDALSMGMSDDFEAAIAEGATMVRIGTAIFGARQT